MMIARILCLLLTSGLDWTSALTDFQFQSIAKEELFRDASQNISEQCQRDYQLFLDSINNTKDLLGPEKFWAFKALDSYGKLPNSGELQLNPFHLGSYSSCLEVEGPKDYDFRGKYCHIYSLVQAGSQSPEELMGQAERGIFTPLIPPFHSAFGSGLFQLYLMISSLSRFGICIPSSCSDEDIQLSLQQLSDDYSTNESQVVIQSLHCEILNEGHSADEGDIVMMCILGIFITICFVGTVFAIINKNFLKGKYDKHKLLNFSVGSSFQKLTSTESLPGHITCIDGIRFFSMTWVLVAHTFTFIIIFPFGNLLGFLSKLSNDIMIRPILNGYVSVDSFFFLSGLLLAFLTLKELDKKEGKINWPLFYIHRYLRLTIVYGIVVGFHATLYRYFNFGPSTINEFEVSSCRRRWWENILYINNYNMDEICLGQSWYVSVEMQMFLVSPLVLWPLWYFNKHKGYIAALTYIGCWIGAFTMVLLTLCIVQEWPATSIVNSGDSSYLYWNYVVPWCRCQPYLVGMATGFLLHVTKKKKITLNQPLVIGLWSAAFAIGLTIVYSLDSGGVGFAGESISLTENVLYGSFHRLGWGLSLAWVVFACFHGYGGWLNNFLSWKGFGPLSRLTFGIYLVHISVIYTLLAQFTFNTETSYFILALLSLVVLVISTLISAAMVVFIELPTMQAEKQLFALFGA